MKVFTANLTHGLALSQAQETKTLPYRHRLIAGNRNSM